MKFEYRYLSEERAAEIDAMGIITPRGRKLRINYTKCITNDDESIVFQIIFHAMGYNVENEVDKYLLFYKGYKYVLTMHGFWTKKKVYGEIKYHTKWIIESEIEEEEDCPSKEVLSVLIEILCERSRHLTSDIIVDGTVEINYLRKRVK